MHPCIQHEKLTSFEFIFCSSSYSHRVVHWPIALALAEKGHKITFISPFGASPEMSSPNVTEIQPTNLKTFMDMVLQQNFDVNHRASGLIPPLFLVLDYFCFNACHEMYKSQEIKTWIASNPQVDLFVGDMLPDCSYGLAKKLGAKLVLFLPIPMVTKHFESFGWSAESSTIPDYDVSRRTPLTFLNRIVGTLLPLWYRMLEMMIYQPKYKTIYEKELGLVTNLPASDVQDMTSLIIINGNYISDYPRSYPPFIIKVYGIHIKKPGEHKQLDKVTYIHSERNGLSLIFNDL
jgi:hypothetical protein